MMANHDDFMQMGHLGAFGSGRSPALIPRAQILDVLKGINVTTNNI